MKSIVALVSALLVSLITFVGVTNSAHAAGGYPKSVDTVCSAWPVDRTVGRFQRPKINYRATPAAGNGTPKGTVRFTFTKNGNVLRTAYRSYDGGRDVFRFKRFRARGTIYVKATLRTPSASVFQNCADRTSFKRR